MRRAAWRTLVLLVLCWLGAAGTASANDCTATMTNIEFVDVSPIAGADSYASGTLVVTCRLTDLIAALLPSISYCISLGEGSGGMVGGARALVAGSTSLPYNLYSDASYDTAAVWGGSTMTSFKTPIKGSMAGLLGLGVFTHTYTVYGKIRAADLAGVPTLNNGPTAYLSNFAADVVLRYTFSILIPFDACVIGSQNTVPFQVRATLINDCAVSADKLDFGTQRLLTGSARANSGLNVRCTKNNAYRIALNAGLHASAGQRRMRNSVTGEYVSYRLSNSLDGVLWDDGSGSGSVVSAVGTGASERVSVYGRIPAQTTPAPGDYSDTVTATITY